MELSFQAQFAELYHAIRLKARIDLVEQGIVNPDTFEIDEVIDRMTTSELMSALINV